MTKPMRTNRPTPSATGRLALVLLAAFMMVTAASCSGDDPSSRTLVITQDPPTLTRFAIPASTSSEAAAPAGSQATPADVLTFDAAITGPDGLAGTLIGYLLTVDLADVATGDFLEERIGTLVFDFGVDTLVVSGGTSYPLNDKQMRIDEPQIRAVIGGTGSFIGSRGEVVTTRNGDGSYTHTFTLLN